MSVAHIKTAGEYLVKGSMVTLNPGRMVVHEDFCKQNDLIKCDKCKEWFDESYQLGQYHIEFNELKQKVYCSVCFNKKYP